MAKQTKNRDYERLNTISVKELQAMRWWICVKCRSCGYPKDQASCDDYTINDQTKDKYIEYLEKFIPIEDIADEYNLSTQYLSGKTRAKDNEILRLYNEVMGL